MHKVSSSRLWLLYTRAKMAEEHWGCNPCSSSQTKWPTHASAPRSTRAEKHKLQLRSQTGVQLATPERKSLRKKTTTLFSKKGRGLSAGNGHKKHSKGSEGSDGERTRRRRRERERKRELMKGHVPKFPQFLTLKGSVKEI